MLYEIKFDNTKNIKLNENIFILQLKIFSFTFMFLVLSKNVKTRSQSKLAGWLFLLPFLKFKSSKDALAVEL